jgi:hypothetical protein
MQDFKVSSEPKQSLASTPEIHLHPILRLHTLLPVRILEKDYAVLPNII